MTRTIIVQANAEGRATRLLRDIITTPGTRLSWWSPLTWIAAHREIEDRRISAKQYRDRDAHLEALVSAGGAAVLALAPLEELLALNRYLRANEQRLAPARGMRAGCPWVLAIDLVDAAIAQRRSGRG